MDRFVECSQKCFLMHQDADVFISKDFLSFDCWQQSSEKKNVADRSAFNQHQMVNSHKKYPKKKTFFK